MIYDPDRVPPSKGTSPQNARKALVILLGFPALACMVLAIFVYFVARSELIDPHEYWEDNRSTSAGATLYFAYLLGRQDDRVYTLAHPDFHAEVDAFMAHHEPVCGDYLTSWVGGKDDIVVYCQCHIRLDGVVTTFNSDIQPHRIVLSVESMQYSSCSSRRD